MEKSKSTFSKNICMFVYNNFLHDSRVEKESQTLLKAGNRVTVLALLDKNTLEREDKAGVEVLRLQVNPWHINFLSYLRSIELKRAMLVLSIIFVLLSEGLFYLFYNQAPLSRKVFFYGALVFGVILAFLVSKRYKTEEQEQSSPIGRLLSCCRNVFRWLLINAFHAPCKSILMVFHRPFCFISFYRKAYQTTRGMGFDVYHAHDLNTLLVAYLAASRDKAKLVYDSHELYVERNRLKKTSWFGKFLMKQFEGFLVRRSDAVITVNESIANVLQTRYGVERVDVVMNAPLRSEVEGSSINRKHSLKELVGVPTNLKLLIYVGSITFNRGIEELIRSLSYLPDCFLVCMGFGNDEYKKSLMKIVTHEGVEDRFSFYGPVPSSEVVEYVSSADLGVAPIANACLSYYYCSPNKLFEYMNAGVPIIASDFPELSKVVLGHRIGITFDPAKPEDIARAAKEVLDDRDMSAEMRKNALSAAKSYNWDNEGVKLAELYEAFDVVEEIR